MDQGKLKHIGKNAKLWETAALALEGNLTKAISLAFGFPLWEQGASIKGKNSFGIEMEIVQVRYMAEKSSGEGWMLVSDIWISAIG